MRNIRSRAKDPGQYYFYAHRLQVSKLASEDTRAQQRKKSYKENIIFNVHICQSNTIPVVVRGDLIAWPLTQQTALWGI